MFGGPALEMRNSVAAPACSERRSTSVSGPGAGGVWSEVGLLRAIFSIVSANKRHRWWCVSLSPVPEFSYLEHRGCLFEEGVYQSKPI
jgi:hypothetical protein